MAKPRVSKRTLNSYSIKAGDCVLMRPSEPSQPSYVGRVERIECDTRGANARVHVRWYYRPEESIEGRRQFHGSREVFLSDHFDFQSADTIECKCTVHSFKRYSKLDAVGNDDFFCRFEYNSATGAFTPDRVAVYCKCEIPYNPDDLMVQCEGCSDWGWGSDVPAPGASVLKPIRSLCTQMTTKYPRQMCTFRVLGGLKSHHFCIMNDRGDTQTTGIDSRSSYVWM